MLRDKTKKKKATIFGRADLLIPCTIWKELSKFKPSSVQKVRYILKKWRIFGVTDKVVPVTNSKQHIWENSVEKSK